MPRRKLLNPCIPVGISFTHEDKQWLLETYGMSGELSISDQIRCAIQDARFWQKHLHLKDPRPDIVGVADV